MKFYQYGRSMVEMLGVLAIIGVLSVGAIAGYSKAMMKYKLNKQAEQLTTVINAGLRYAGQWNFNESFGYTMPYLIKLGEIPKEMIKDDPQHIYDVFNTPMYLAYTKTDTAKYTQFFIMLNTSGGDDNSLNICRNIVTTAKEFHQNVRYIAILSKNSNGYYDFQTYYGDNFCKSDRLCMKDLTVSKIDEWCRYNIDKTDTPHIKIVWDE